MTDNDEGSWRGLKWRFLDDVICERPLKVSTLVNDRSMSNEYRPRNRRIIFMKYADVFGRESANSVTCG